MHYRIELWRNRDGWFDAMDREGEWDVVVRHEPLLDQYTVTRLVGRQQRENRYATLEALGATLGSAYQVTLTAASDGRLYYVATLEVTTLSDSDLQELERFLKGDLTPAAAGDGQCRRGDGTGGDPAGAQAGGTAQHHRAGQIGEIRSQEWAVTAAGRRGRAGPRRRRRA